MSLCHEKVFSCLLNFKSHYWKPWLQMYLCFRVAELSWTFGSWFPPYFFHVPLLGRERGCGA